MKHLTKRTLAVALALLLALSIAVPALAEDAAVDDGMATRGDIVWYLYGEYGQAFPAGETELTFTDVPADSGVAEAAAWAASLGIAKGYGDGRFGPADLVTREQAATMLYRFAQVTGQGFRGAWMFLLNYADASEVSDWASEAVHWLVMKGAMPGVEGDDPVERLAPKDGIGINEVPVWLRQLGDALATVLENDGYTLTIPVQYAALLNTEIPADAPEGTLFAVAEQASIDAARKQYPDNYAGAGGIFAIQKIGEAEVKQLLTQDMSGRQIIAKDDEGNHFLFCTPTDVRFFRDTTEEMMADSDVWTALNEWGAEARDRFINDNGLTADFHGNTDVDIALYRAAYAEDAKYTLSTTQFGPLEPVDSVDAAAYVENALAGMTFEYYDGEAPDGEYVVLKFENGDRYDFFTGEGGNYVRRVVDLGELGAYEYLYQAVYDDGETVLHDIMEEWYMALASAHGKA
jgi:hypothetical protein